MCVCIFEQTLRRLAQNREAARKSRLRKKVVTVEKFKEIKYSFSLVIIYWFFMLRKMYFLVRRIYVI